MADETLAPCPFCGNGPHADGKWGVGVGGDEAGKEFGVICSGCGASSSLTCESESEAIAAWNRRAPAEAARGAWRTIDSAPRDGMKVDLWAVFWNGVIGEPQGERCVNGRFKDGGWEDQWGNRLDWEDGPDDEGITSWRRVTHWQPLHAPPDAEEDK
jgi:Lar family restriction alleviation protein